MDKDIKKDVGLKIRQARQDRELSQQELSQKSGVNQANLSKMENGLIDMRISTLDDLAEGMHMNLNISFEPKENENISHKSQK